MTWRNASDAWTGRGFWIRAELISSALAVPLVAGVLFVAAPGFTGGWYEPTLTERALPWVGVLLWVVGLAWMFRLSQPRVEPGERLWRYRDF